MPPSVPPPPAPQITTSQVTPPAIATRFRDLNTSQARWLEVLEKHGILRTQPTSEFFGPERPVRRDELLMSEARIIELVLRRDQEQQALIERLKGELAQLEGLKTEIAQLRSAYRALADASAGQPEPSAAAAGEVATRPKLALEKPDLVPMAVRSDTPVPVAQLHRSSQGAAAEQVDLKALWRHRYRLRQFPQLQRFLDRAIHLDPNDSDYQSFLQSYMATASMTPALLAEASRQAAWLDASQVS